MPGFLEGWNANQKEIIDYAKECPEHSSFFFGHPRGTNPFGCDYPIEEEMSEEKPAGAEAKPSSESKKIDVDKPVFFKHWVRPRTSQYSYLYDYRRNYYDDVIDYLDRRKSGMYREVPRPQTWAERALRTYTQKLGTTENAIKAKTDSDLIHKVQQSRFIHTIHTKLNHARHFTFAY